MTRDQAAAAWFLHCHTLDNIHKKAMASGDETTRVIQTSIQGARRNIEQQIAKLTPEQVEGAIQAFGSDNGDHFLKVSL